jgi:hypothetical protein
MLHDKCVSKTGSEGDTNMVKNRQQLCHKSDVMLRWHWMTNGVDNAATVEELRGDSSVPDMGHLVTVGHQEESNDGGDKRVI